MNARVAVVGSGYVGTVVAACLASIGREVVGVEADEAKLAQLSAGESPFFEPGLDQLLAAAHQSGRLRFTRDIADAVDSSEVVFLCVGTPPGANGHADMSAVRSAAASIGRALRTPHVLVTKSTVPIGSGHWLASVVEAAYDGPQPIDELLAIASCPEFLREGNAIEDFLHPDRIVVGSDTPAAIDKVFAVYRPIIEQDFDGGDPDRCPAAVRTTLLTAETVKYASNAFLATKISFANEIAQICELVGADASDVMATIGLDSRIGPRFLDAGVGWGGSCFGKDLLELISTAHDFDHVPTLLQAVVDVNNYQRRSVIERLHRHLKTLAGKRICLLGLAFKPGTDDLRDAPAVAIAAALLAAGAVVTAHDPMILSVRDLPELQIEVDPLAAAKRADAVVLLTEWPAYLALAPEALAFAMRGRLIIDGRNALDGDDYRRSGFTYEGIGRAVSR